MIPDSTGRVSIVKEPVEPRSAECDRPSSSIELIIYLIWQNDACDGAQAHAASAIGRVQQSVIICP